MIKPVVSYQEIFDPEKYSALPIKQRQRFGAALLRIILAPRFLYRFFLGGGRLDRTLSRPFRRS